MGVLDAMSQPSFGSSAEFASALSAGVAADVAAALQPLQAQLSALSAKVDSLGSGTPPPPSGDTTKPKDQTVTISPNFAVDPPVASFSGGGLYAIGDIAVLTVSNINSGYRFVGWYTSDGTQVSTETTYRYSVVAGGQAFEARFRLASRNEIDTTLSFPSPTPSPSFQVGASPSIGGETPVPTPSPSAQSQLTPEPTPTLSSTTGGGGGGGGGGGATVLT